MKKKVSSTLVGVSGEYLRKTVTDDTRGKQTPEVGSFRYSDSGKFVFFT